MRDNDKYIFVDEDTLNLLKSIKQERKKRGLSLRQLAALTGITHQSLSHYENLIRSPVLENFLKLAEFFHWDILITSTSYSPIMKRIYAIFDASSSLTASLWMNFKTSREMFLTALSTTSFTATAVLKLSLSLKIFSTKNIA